MPVDLTLKEWLGGHYFNCDEEIKPWEALSTNGDTNNIYQGLVHSWERLHDQIIDTSEELGEEKKTTHTNSKMIY